MQNKRTDPQFNPPLPKIQCQNYLHPETNTTPYSNSDRVTRRTWQNKPRDVTTFACDMVRDISVTNSVDTLGYKIIRSEVCCANLSRDIMTLRWLSLCHLFKCLLLFVIVSSFESGWGFNVFGVVLESFCDYFWLVGWLN